MPLWHNFTRILNNDLIMHTKHVRLYYYFYFFFSTKLGAWSHPMFISDTLNEFSGNELEARHAQYPNILCRNYNGSRQMRELSIRILMVSVTSGGGPAEIIRWVGFLGFLLRNKWICNSRVTSKFQNMWVKNTQKLDHRYSS